MKTKKEFPPVPPVIFGLFSDAHPDEQKPGGWIATCPSCRRKNALRVNGMDEPVCVWGCDDEKIFMRLQISEERYFAELDQDDDGGDRRRSLLRSFTLGELRDRPIQERDLIVAPFLGRFESQLLYGPKGHGKTWVSGGCAIVGAQGDGAKFLKFRADGPGVLSIFFDGEMFFFVSPQSVTAGNLERRRIRSRFGCRPTSFPRLSPLAGRAGGTRAQDRRRSHPSAKARLSRGRSRGRIDGHGQTTTGLSGSRAARLREEEHTMGLSVCPAAIVAAPVEVVWGNLVQWERYFEWADVQVERREPEGPATVGQTITFGGKAFGRTLHFIFKVEAVNPERHQLDLHVFFPLGLQEKAHIACTPIDATTCRVQYG